MHRKTTVAVVWHENSDCLPLTMS